MVNTFVETGSEHTEKKKAKNFVTFDRGPSSDIYSVRG